MNIIKASGCHFGTSFSDFVAVFLISPAGCTGDGGKVKNTTL